MPVPSVSYKVMHQCDNISVSSSVSSLLVVRVYPAASRRATIETAPPMDGSSYASEGLEKKGMIDPVCQSVSHCNRQHTRNNGAGNVASKLVRFRM